MAFDTARAAAAVGELLRAFGADAASPELAETPQRVADFWAERLSGYGQDPSQELQPLPGVLAPCPVILDRVPFVSTCEHHLAPFEGFATIGYLPGEGGTVGLSKLVRVVQGYANRLQVQERLTHQIAQALETHLRPAAWGVKLVAVHTCMSHRGPKTPQVPVTTQVLGGQWLTQPPASFQA
ncbi:GTP cyclohydrolase I [Mesoterricola silvestris]|uniref:GTP cyclohydrolase I n=1 Tax=Mesoterricola silvestris TaxID=2927979 RepID=A0AA48GIS0_9BACT|nr:GTP cyclohydrolase I FolE [Mesoterricola silvestris]BDU71814.1 GTP cyclohydrolase 1 [Mesoterricola silvestris]